MKGQLPKAYLRIDPNLDHTHPDPGLFIRLLCAAARQPRRGWFRDRSVLLACLGKRGSERLLERGDVVEKDGALHVDGWDIWQEGDMTVSERMARYRNKERNSTVTAGVTLSLEKRNTPSETVRQQGSKAVETENERSFSPGSESGNGHGPLTETERQDYADAVWEAFLQRSDQPPTRIMSPAEFSTLKGWMDGGIPLCVVLRGMEDTKGKGSSLAYYSPSVRSAYDYYRQAMA